MSEKKTLSFNQFIKRFPNEKACAEYLSGPTASCALCAAISIAIPSKASADQCAKCHHQTSLTANTVMHRSHLPLKK